jgi:hypothetical protein
MKVALYFCWIFLMLGISHLYQENSKEDQKPKTVSLALQNKILRAQKAEIQIGADAKACQRNFLGDFQVQDGVIKIAIAEAYKEAGLDQKDYDVNIDTFEFVKKVKAPEPAPAKPARLEEKKPQ